MLNQKTVIYIILSAILLYLYYKRGGIAIFGVFVVVVVGTLIIGKDFDSIEGMKGKKGKGKGKSKSKGGGGGGGECAKMGFTEPKISKNENGDVGESLEKEMKKIKKIADKYWPYDEKGNSNDETEKTILEKYINTYMKILEQNKFSNDESKITDVFMQTSSDFYSRVNSSDESKRKKIELNVNDLPKGYIKTYLIPTKFSKVLEETSKSGELKDKGSKKLAKYLDCLCKHWIAIYTKIDSMATGKKSGSSKNEDNEDEDDEEKPKKKEKATKKKKKSDEGDDEGNDEE